jgi:hypothetical protein
MKRLSIRIRLSLWYLAIFAIAQTAFGAGMWFILRANLNGLLDHGLEIQIDDLRSFLETLGKDPTLARLREEVNETYAIEHQGNYLAVWVRMAT